MRTHRFDTTGPVDLDVTIRSGRVLVETSQNDETVVEIDGSDAALLDEVTVQHEPYGDGHRVVVRVPRLTERGFMRVFARSSLDVRVTVPEQALADVSSGDGDLRLSGTYREIRASTASGAVEVGEVTGPATINTASGDVALESVGGRTKIRTASGDVRCGDIDGGDIKTASGNVRVATSTDRVTVTTGSGDIELGGSDDCMLRTASGDIRVGGIRQGTADLKTASGDIDIAVVAGGVVAIDAESVSGDLSSEIELSGVEPIATDSDREVELVLRTVSGDIQVRRTQDHAAV